MVHVPYHTNYFPDLLGGQIQATFTPVALALEFIKAGKLRALAVTGVTRTDSLPEIPAVAEFIPGYEAYVWDGIGAPKTTPVEIIGKLNREVNFVLADPVMRAQFSNLGAQPMPMTSADFGKFIAEEIEKCGKVIRAAKLKLD